MKAEIKKILKTPYKPKFEMPQKGEEKNKRSISSARQGEFSSTHLTTFRYQAETIYTPLSISLPDMLAKQ